MFLKYTAIDGRKFRLHPRQIGGYNSEGRNTRILASIAGIPVTFVVEKTVEQIDDDIEKSHLDEQEQGS